MTRIAQGPDEKFAVTIYHNPNCSQSRTALGIIREAGIEPEIVEYLKTPASRAKLVKLMQAAGLDPRELVRAKEKVFVELNLSGAAVTDAEILDAMAAHPILMNRPIVVTAKGTRLCRPGDKVRELLP